MDAVDTHVHNALPSSSRRRRGAVRPIVIAVLLGLALRLAFGLGYWRHQPLTRDEQEYFSLARSLSSGHGFVYDEVLRNGSFVPFGRAPGYPAFLALVGGGREVVTSVPARVKIAQSVLGALGVLLVAAIGVRIAGARTGIVAAFLAAVYPPLVWISAYGFSEALFWPVGLLAIWLVDHSIGRSADRSIDRSLGRSVEAGAGAAGAPRVRSPRGFASNASGEPRTAAQAAGWMLAAGLVTGTAVLIRPAFLLFVVLAALWMAIRSRWRLSAALVAGVCLVILPWTLRNYAVHGRVVLVASDGGVTFWTGNHPLAVGDGDMAANPALKRANLELRARYPGATEEAMEPIYYRDALAWIRAHPIDWMTLEARKAFYLLVPIGPSYFVHSRLYYYASIVPYLMLLPLALRGAMRMPHPESTPALWLAAASAALVCLIFFPQERFRIPTLDPTLILCASAALRRRPELT